MIYEINQRGRHFYPCECRDPWDEDIFYLMEAERLFLLFYTFLISKVNNRELLVGILVFLVDVILILAPFFKILYLCKVNLSTNIDDFWLDFS